jgi:hypothetical protein
MLILQAYLLVRKKSTVHVANVQKSARRKRIRNETREIRCMLKESKGLSQKLESSKTPVWKPHVSKQNNILIVPPKHVPACSYRATG